MKFIQINILYIYKSIKYTELRLKMAFLLLLHQKMRLQRKQNQLTLKQLRFSSLVERMQKKVDKREKYYAKLEKQLERQANYYKNNANIFFSQMSGLGSNSVNLSNPYAPNGAVMSMLQNMTPAQVNEYLKQCSGGQLKESLSDAACNIVKNGGIREIRGEDGKTKYVEAWTGNEVNKDSLGADPTVIYQATNALQQMAQMQVSNMQTQMSQMKSNYENNVSIWLEAQQEQLDAQKEWEMDLLAEEQADLEAEKTSVEAQLEIVKQEKQNIEQALGQAIQDSAPKFGLA